MLDTLICGATVYDGVHPAPRSVSVGLRAGRIAWVGPTPVGQSARQTVQADGLLLCPGFIDVHASTGLGYTLPEAADHKLYQGVTTEVIGNCGTSNAPIGEHLLADAAAQAERIGIPLTWRSTCEWLDQLDAHGLPINAATHIGHNTLRASAGAWAAQPTPTQQRTMADLLEEGLSAGALGLSTGLIYPPGCFATTDEIIALARIASRYSGLYVSHIRDERAHLLDAVEEALAIGTAADLPVLISHLKSAEQANHGRIPAILRRLEQARAAGQAVTFSVYPYTAVSTRLRAFLPIESMQDGTAGLRGWLAANRSAALAGLRARGTDFTALTLITESLPGARGRTVADLARQRSVAPDLLTLQILQADPEAFIVYRCIAAADMHAAICWPDAIICSDSWSYPVNAPNPIGDPHPRTFGAFTRFLERYAFCSGRLSVGEAIRRITALPADWLGLTDRGRILTGAAADLTLLDPQRVRERATYTDPRQFSAGTVQVWVAGCAMFDPEGQLRPLRPGRTLRRGSR